MAEWWQCEECIFATNSPKSAHIHSSQTGHEVIEDD